MHLYSQYLCQKTVLIRTPEGPMYPFLATLPLEDNHSPDWSHCQFAIPIFELDLNEIK